MRKGYQRLNDDRQANESKSAPKCSPIIDPATIQITWDASSGSLPMHTGAGFAPGKWATANATVAETAVEASPYSDDYSYGTSKCAQPCGHCPTGCKCSGFICVKDE